jgi:methyl-accepting chemotaxis protein
MQTGTPNPSPDGAGSSSGNQPSKPPLPQAQLQGTTTSGFGQQQVQVTDFRQRPLQIVLVTMGSLGILSITILLVLIVIGGGNFTPTILISLLSSLFTVAITVVGYRLTQRGQIQLTMYLLLFVLDASITSCLIFLGVDGSGVIPLMSLALLFMIFSYSWVAHLIHLIYFPLLIIIGANLDGRGGFGSVLGTLICTVLFMVLGFMFSTGLRAQAEDRLQQLEQSSTLVKLLRRARTAAANMSKNTLRLAGELQASATDQTKETGEQATATAELVATAGELGESSAAIAESVQATSTYLTNITHETDRVEAVSTALLAKNRQALELVEVAHQENIRFNTRYGEVLTRLQNTSATYESLREVATIIRGIAQEVHLLSLNAGIESAGVGGVFGERFAVVAAETRGLANNIKTQTSQTEQTIDAAIEEFSRTVAQVADLQEAVNAIFTKSASSVGVLKEFSEVLTAFLDQVANIRTAVSEVALRVEIVESNTTAQAVALGGMVAILHSLEITINNSLARARQIASAALNLHTVTGDLDRVLSDAASHSQSQPQANSSSAGGTDLGSNRESEGEGKEGNTQHSSGAGTRRLHISIT